jgi:ergothioneine biosynthesis protein EgtB
LNQSTSSIPAPSAILAPQLDVSASAFIKRFRRVRAASTSIAAPLSPEDCQVQSTPDASPIKWHLAHTTWFFETFLLSDYAKGYRAFNETYKVLFNSYYNGVGDRHPRVERGLVSRPSLAEVLAYRKYVDSAIESWLASIDFSRNHDVVSLLLLGFNHEEQHQELMFTDVKHMLSMNPLCPAYASDAPQPRAIDSRTLDWISFEGGVTDIGFDGASDFAFDNESPKHRALLHPYRIADRLVTNREYLEFMQDGAYRDHSLWLADGWDWVNNHGINSPMYWQRRDHKWHQFTLSGLREIELDAPVCHVSFYEADAFARWAGVRLPTEFEWEHAARSNSKLKQMSNSVWQWTASAYLAYPGFSPKRGAVGEYNGKFMNQQYVLRGGSCATAAHHARASYRNFFQPDKRWQFTGIRLAK